MSSKHTVSFTNITLNKWWQSAATHPLDLVDQSYFASILRILLY